MSPLWPVIDATWRAPKLHHCGPFTLREGQGGGQRVSAATTQGHPDANDVRQAAQAMQDFGQSPLFMVRGDQPDFDRLLADLGYGINDPVTVLEGPIAAAAAQAPPPVSAFTAWPPLQIMEDIWAEGGIGPARVSIMMHVAPPKIALLSRAQDRAVGCGFVAIHAGVAMIHALEVLATCRREGAGRHMVQAAALWAQAQGATRLAALTTRDNLASQGLFKSLGLDVVDRYHYRRLPQEDQL